MAQHYGSGSRKKFFMFLTGKTNGAHKSIVENLRHDGHKEMDSPDDCDYLLVFCPVVSRVQSDIQDGLSRIPTNKPVILVVMHPTFDPNHVIAESRRQVNNQNVHLTVDYLFHKNDLLNCKLNVSSWADIQRFLLHPNKQKSSLISVKHASQSGNPTTQNRNLYGSIDGVDGEQSTVMDQKHRSGPGNKFFVILTGKTNGAHKSIVNKLKGDGLIEVGSPDVCDFLLVFCPVASRVQSDIENGLSTIPANKPVILVVMHHTFDPEHIVAESRRQVTNPNVLTVDFLFHEQSLLNCNRNDISYHDIQGFLKGPSTQECSTCMTCVMEFRWHFVIFAILLTGILLVIMILIELQ